MSRKDPLPENGTRPDAASGSDDFDSFAEAVGDVRPVKGEAKIPLVRDGDSKLTVSARRHAAVTAAELDRNHLRAEGIEILDPYYPLEFRRDGVQHGVFRKLKQGRYAIEAQLDLHRLTVEQARREVFEFVREASACDLRSALIVHGRGAHNRSRSAVLKSYINHWLPELDAVQAFCSAQPRHGGTGAVYLMLKKSARAKQSNREHFSKGRIDT